MPIFGQGRIYFARHRIGGTKSHVGKLVSTYIVKIGQSFLVLLKAAS